MENKINKDNLNINDICTKLNKRKHQIIKDYLICKSKYKINYNDYLKMHLYQINDDKRKEILTPNKSKELINNLNPFDKRYLIISKSEFYHTFYQYIKRDWLVLDEKNNEEFRLFIKSRSHIFVPALDNHKPEIVDIERSNEWELHQELINSHHYIVEEIIKHHDKFNVITDQKLITIKFITLLENNLVHILGCYLDIEIKEDNYYIPVDLNTGKTYDKALKNNEIVTNINNYNIKSFKLPLWKNTLKMINKLPLVIPELKYISWDIAISAEEPILISASDEPNYLVLQHPIYLEKNDGLLKQINSILEGEKK